MSDIIIINLSDGNKFQVAALSEKAIAWLSGSGLFNPEDVEGSAAFIGGERVAEITQSATSAGLAVNDD
jgi:hypothetical protein